jgi:hypothetical protein
MKEYQVDMVASFKVIERDPESINKRIKKIILHQGFSDKSFEISIATISQRGEHIEKPVEKPLPPSKKKPIKKKPLKVTKKSIKKPASKVKSKKSTLHNK